MQNQADVDVRLIVPVMESIESSLKKLFNIEIQRGQMYVIDIPLISMGIGAVIKLSGDFNGKILLDMLPNAAVRLTSLFLRENITKFDELVISTVGEILNNIAGSAIAKIQSYGSVKISPPYMITRKTVSSNAVEHKNVLIIPLLIEKYLINVSFFLI